MFPTTEAIDLIIHNGRVGEVYNVGGHNERTNLEVVKTILKALHKPESLIRFVTDRPGHDRRYAIDPTKLETELGWKPKYNFDTGIQQTIQWYLDNEDWWKHIISGEYSQYFDKMYGKRLGEIMRILVTGVKGQLGHDVVNEMVKRGLEPVGVDLEEMDITDAGACRRVITEAKVDAVIHCAAYTAVDAAEDNVDVCRKVNADGTRTLQRSAATWISR